MNRKPASHIHANVMASRRYSRGVPGLSRSTVCFDPGIHRALRAKAAATDRSVSDLVGEAVRLTLAGDADDLSALQKRASEPDLDFEKVVQSLKRRGKL